MANVIKTVLTYQLDGSKRDFNIPFEYLARKFVVVTLIGVDRKVLTINTDYRFATRTTISLTKAFGPADGYTTIELRRVTSTTDRLVDFTDGSILRAYDLNVAQIQTMHVAEEARDLTADTIGVNNDGHLDARGRKIVNLAFATGDYDAVPLKQIKEREHSAWNAVIKSDEHANRSNNEANRSRDEADRAGREADRSTQQAGVSTAQAVESKTQADRSNSEANRAKGYADSTTASVAEAKKQADRSNSEANRARDAANRASGEVTKAAAEVAKAAAHVETAKGHADQANSEANRSKGEADRAKREADKLGNWNALAGTVQDVAGENVAWHGIHTAKEFRALGADGFRLINGGYGAFFRNDGTNLYLLLTDRGSPLGGCNSLRPFNVNLASGIPSFPQGGVFSGAVTVFRPAGPQLVVNGLSNQASYILGQTDNRNSWYVGKGNAGSADVALHSYDLNTSIFLRGDRIELSKSVNVKGEVRTLNSALQNDGDIRGGRWGGGALSATIHRNRVVYQRTFNGVWRLGQTVTFTDAPISQQFLVVGIEMSSGQVDYVSVCTPSGGGNFWINIGQWSYRINTSTDGWSATMMIAQATTPNTPVGVIREVYVVRTDLS